MTERTEHYVEDPDSDYMQEDDVVRNNAWFDDETAEIDRLAELTGDPKWRETSPDEAQGDEGEGPYARPDAAPPEGGG